MTIISPPPDVKHDMERVFRPLPAMTPGSPAARSLLDAPSWWRQHVLALAGAAVMLACLFIGLIAFAPLHSTSPAAPAPLPQPPVATPAVPPQAAASQAAPAPAMPSLTLAAPVKTSVPAPKAATKKTAEAAPRRAPESDGEKLQSSEAASSAREQEPPICRNFRDRDACFDREVMSSDHRLRQVYDQALDSPLPTSQLVKVRRSWSDALSRSRHAPRESIRALDRLTMALKDDIAEASRPHDD